MVAVPEVHYARDESGAAIAYQVWGAGPVDLLLMTDWATSVDNMWEHPARVRSLGFAGSLGRVIRFDCRGTGASDPVSLDRIGDLEQWARDATLVMDAVGVERAVVSAEGFAGQAAMLLAATEPVRVERLGLQNSFAQFVASDAVETTVAAAVPFVREQWGTGACTRRVGSLAAGAEPGFCARTERLAASPLIAAALVEATIRSDVRALLGKIVVPTLVLYTGDLPAYTFEHSEYLAAHIPGARIIHTRAPAFYWDDPGFVEFAEFLSGHGADMAKRELATVVFTDVVGSTEFAARVGDRRWSETFGHLDRFVRIHVERCGGRVVQHTGDGHILTFSTPHAAIEGTRELLAAAPSLGIELRGGIHTGEVEHGPAGDIAGLGVHIAARVAALAGAGELMVSRTVVDLMAGSDTQFEDRDEHELKGVPGRWRIFAVVG